MPADFKLIVITPEKDLIEESSKVTQLFGAGLPILHIRKPNHTRQEVKNLITGIPADFHNRIVLHQHYELLNEFNLKGAHLPENRRREGNFNGIPNIISTSFHKLEDIIRERKSFEYAFFSPVFKSISKKSHESAVDMNTLRTFFQSNSIVLRFPVIALGGISELNISETKKIGFGGAACIGNIWESVSPVDQFNLLMKTLES